MNKNIINLESGKMVRESEIKELVSIEMNDSCHEDYPEDYDNARDFYLSALNRDGYAEHYLPTYFSDCDTERNYSRRDYDEIHTLVMEGVNLELDSMDL